MSEQNTTPEQIRQFWHEWIDKVTDRQIVMFHNMQMAGSTEAIDAALAEVDRYIAVALTKLPPTNAA